MSKRKHDRKWLNELHKEAIELVNRSNSKFRPERQVSIKSALTVLDRSLVNTHSSSQEARKFAALRALSSFISLTSVAKTSVSSLENADLLPVGHPFSRAQHMMSIDAFRSARAQWIASDPLIDDSMRSLVASAHSLEPGSIERQHAFARIAAAGPKLVPITAAIDIGDADIAHTYTPMPIVAGLLSFVGGNSRAARSMRAKLQRRDRYGRFAFMGGGFSFKMKMGDGSFRSFSGRVVGRGTEADANSGLVEVELMRGSGGINVAGQIVKVPADKGTAVKAIIPQEGLEGLPDQGEVQPDDVFVSAAQMIQSKTGAPDGWKPVKKAKDSDGNEYTTQWESPDGYVVNGVGAYSHSNDYENVGRGSAGWATRRQPQLQPARKELDFVDFPAVDTWADVEDLLSRDQNDYAADIKKYNSLDGDNAAQNAWVADQQAKGRSDASNKPQILREESDAFAEQLQDAVGDDKGIRFTANGEDITFKPTEVTDTSVKGTDKDGKEREINLADIESMPEEADVAEAEEKAPAPAEVKEGGEPPKIFDSRVSTPLTPGESGPNWSNTVSATRGGQAIEWNHTPSIGRPTHTITERFDTPGFGQGEPVQSYTAWRDGNGYRLKGGSKPVGSGKTWNEAMAAIEADMPETEKLIAERDQASKKLEANKVVPLGPPSAPGEKNPVAGLTESRWIPTPKGKIRMSDGSQTIYFDPTDGDGIYEAKRDGFREVSGTSGGGGSNREVPKYRPSTGITRDLQPFENAQQLENALNEAISKGDNVRFKYGAKEVTFQPAKVYTNKKNGNRNVNGWSVTDGDERTYNIDKVSPIEPKPAAKTAKPPKPAEAATPSGTYDTLESALKNKNATGSQILSTIFDGANGRSLEEHFDVVPDSMPKNSEIVAIGGDGDVLYGRNPDGSYFIAEATGEDDEVQVTELNKVDETFPQFVREQFIEPLDDPRGPMFFYRGTFIDDKREKDFLASLPEPTPSGEGDTIDFNSHTDPLPDLNQRRVQMAMDKGQQLRVNYKGKDRTIDPQRLWVNPKTGKDIVTALDMSDGGKEKNFFVSELTGPSKPEPQAQEPVRVGLTEEDDAKAQSTANAFRKKIADDKDFAGFVENSDKSISMEELMQQFDSAMKAFETESDNKHILSFEVGTVDANIEDDGDVTLTPTGRTTAMAQGDPYTTTDSVAADILKEMRYLADGKIPGVDPDNDHMYTQYERFTAVVGFERSRGRITQKDANWLNNYNSVILNYKTYGGSQGIPEGVNRATELSKRYQALVDSGQVESKEDAPGIWDQYNQDIENAINKLTTLAEEVLANLQDPSEELEKKQTNLSPIIRQIGRLTNAKPDDRQKIVDTVENLLDEDVNNGNISQETRNSVLSGALSLSADPETSEETLSDVTAALITTVERLYFTPPDWTGFTSIDKTTLDTWTDNFRPDQSVIIDYNGERTVVKPIGSTFDDLTGTIPLAKVEDMTGQVVWLRGDRINRPADPIEEFTLPTYDGSIRNYLNPIIEEVISTTANSTSIAKLNAAISELESERSISNIIAQRLRVLSKNTELLMYSKGRLRWALDDISTAHEAGNDTAEKMVQNRQPFDLRRAGLYSVADHLGIWSQHNSKPNVEKPLRFKFTNPATGNDEIATPIEYAKDSLSLTYLDENGETKQINVADVFFEEIDAAEAAGSMAIEDSTAEVDLSNMSDDDRLAAIKEAILNAQEVAFSYHEKPRVVIPMEITVNPKNNRPKLRGIEKATGVEKEFFLDKFDKPVSNALKQADADSVMNMSQEDFDQFFDATWPTKKDVISEEIKNSKTTEYHARQIENISDVTPEAAPRAAALQKIDTKGSTAISRAAWSSETGDLFIQFESKDGKGGGIYRYPNVDNDFVDRFAASDSLGKMIPELKKISKGEKIDEFPGTAARIEKDLAYRQTLAREFYTALSDVIATLNLDFEELFNLGGPKIEGASRSKARQALNEIADGYGLIRRIFSNPMPRSDVEKARNKFFKDYEVSFNKWADGLGEAWDASRSGQAGDLGQILDYNSYDEIFKEDASNLVDGLRKGSRKIVFDIGYAESPEETIKRLTEDHGFTAELTGSDWHGGYPEVEVTVEDSAIANADLMDILGLVPEEFYSALATGDQILYGYRVDIPEFLAEGGEDYVQSQREVDRWTSKNNTKAEARFITPGVVRLHGSPEEIRDALNIAVGADRVGEFMSRAFRSSDIVETATTLPGEIDDENTIEVSDATPSFSEEAFNELYPEVAEGFYKVNTIDQYLPKGPGSDVKSSDYTDDPKVLSTKFGLVELAMALKNAVSTDEDTESPATGFGQLRFDAGDEYVSAEALYAAIGQGLADADQLLAGIYDRGSGGTENTERALDRAAALRQAAENAPIDDFTQSIINMADDARMEQNERMKILNGFLANPSAAYRVVRQLETFVESNEKIIEIADRLKWIQDNDPDPERVNLGTFLDQYLPLATSPVDADREAFRGVWGLLMSLDGGDTGDFEGLRDNEEHTRAAIFRSLVRLEGSDIAAEEAYEELIGIYGGYPEFVLGRQQIANGEDDLNSKTVAAAFTRLVAAAARPNEVQLARYIGIAKDDPNMEIYLTEGSIFDMDPRSFTSSDILTQSTKLSAQTDSRNQGLDKVYFVLEPGQGKSISAHRVSPFSVEFEHFVYGTYEVVSSKSSFIKLGSMEEKHVVVLKQVDTSAAKSSVLDDFEPTEDVVVPDYGDISSWKETTPDSQAGSNAGGFFKDANGNEYYIKEGRSQSHVDNETLATAFYRELGIPVPLQGYAMKDGDLWLVSPIVSKKRGFRDLRKDENFISQIRDGFVVDAWLSNYDVTGLVYDNIVPGEDGAPMRIDNGGALRWRATGGEKWWFDEEVTELDTMLDPDLARIPASAVVFGDMTEAEIVQSARKLLDISPSRIASMVKSAVKDPDEASELTRILVARRENILKRYGLDTVNPDADILGEPTSLATSIGYQARDLQPEDVTTGDSFVIERVFHDADTPKGKVSVEGYFPGHETQRKEWNEGTVIDVFRGAPIPQKGDKPALHRPKRPFEPKPPAFTGTAAQLLDGATSWEEVRNRLRDSEVIFFDYETTGFPDRDKGDFSTNQPVQLGAVRVVNGEVVDRLNVYMNPGEPLGLWSRENLKRDGDIILTDEWLAEQPGKDDAHREFVEWAGQGAIFAAHNAPFDIGVFDKAVQAAGIDYTPAGVIDTLKLSQQFMPSKSQKVKPDPNGPLNHKLPTLVEFFGGELAGWHTADADAEAVAGVLGGILGAIADKPLPDLAKDAQKYARDKENFDRASKEYAQALLDYETAKAVAAAWNCRGDDGLTAAGDRYGKDCNVPSVDQIIKRATPDASDFVDPDGIHSGPTDGSSSPLPDRGADDLEEYIIPFPENVDPADLFSLEKFMPTLQQQNIIAAWLTGENVVVLAKAGTGKTTTLVLGARVIQGLEPGKKLLYIAYNRSVADEARTKFPPNTIVKTSDAIAYNFVKTQYPNLFSKFNSDTAMFAKDDIGKYLGLSAVKIDDEDYTAADIAALVQDTVFKFEISADPMLDMKHVFEVDMPQELLDTVFSAAQMYWSDILNPDGKLPFAFNEMKKLWSMSKPDFSGLDSGVTTPIDIVMLDEAQDTNDAVGSVVVGQQIQVIMVGDPDQAIYQFNGAKDQLQNAVAPYRLPLTESWRYGPEIAGFANRFLSLKEQIYKVVTNRGIGRGPTGRVVDAGTMTDAEAVIVRSNAGAFGEILEEIENGRTVGVTKSFYADLKGFIEATEWLQKGGKASGEKRPTRMPEELRGYPTWKEVVKESNKGEKSEFGSKTNILIETVEEDGVKGLYDLLSKIKQIESVSDAKKSMGGGTGGAPSEYDIPDELGVGAYGQLTDGISFSVDPVGITITGKKTFPYKEQIKKAGAKWNGDSKVWKIPATTDDARRSALEKLQKLIRELEDFGTAEDRAAQGIDVVVSTAHQMKGLEFGRVRVGGDFRGPIKDKETGEMRWPSLPEFNLAYVTATRAINELDPGSLDWILDATTNKDESPFPTQETEEVEEAEVESEDIVPAPEAGEESGGGGEEPPSVTPVDTPDSGEPSADEQAVYDALDKVYYAIQDSADTKGVKDFGAKAGTKALIDLRKNLKGIFADNPELDDLVDRIIGDIEAKKFEYPEEAIVAGQKELPVIFGRETAQEPGTVETSQDDQGTVSTAPDIETPDEPITDKEIERLLESLPETVGTFNLQFIRDRFAEVDAMFDVARDNVSRSSSKETIERIRESVNEVLRDLVAGNITIDDAYERLAEVAESVPQIPLQTKNPDAAEIEALADYVNAIRDAIEETKFGRRLQKDLPPPELLNKQGQPMGTSKNGILIRRGMRVRDKNGYAGRVLEYNKSDWIGVFVRFELDPREQTAVKKGNWGPGVARVIRTASTLDVIGEDEAPWEDVRTDAQKQKDTDKGVDPRPSNYDQQLEIYNNMIKRRSEQAWSGEESERSDDDGDGDDDGGGGGVSPTPSDDDGGDFPKAEAPEGASEASDELADQLGEEISSPDGNQNSLASRSPDDEILFTLITSGGSSDKDVELNKRWTDHLVQYTEGDGPADSAIKEVTDFLASLGNTWIDMGEEDVLKKLIEKKLVAVTAPDEKNSEERYSASRALTSVLHGIAGFTSGLFYSSKDEKEAKNTIDEMKKSSFYADGGGYLNEPPTQYNDSIGVEKNVKDFWKNFATILNNPEVLSQPSEDNAKLLRSSAGVLLRALRVAAPLEGTFTRVLHFMEDIEDKSHPLHYMLNEGQEVLLRPTSWMQRKGDTDIADLEDDGLFQYGEFGREEGALGDVLFTVTNAHGVNARPLPNDYGESEVILTGGRYKVVKAEKKEINGHPYTHFTLEDISREQVDFEDEFPSANRTSSVDDLVAADIAELARWNKAKPIQDPAQFLSKLEDDLWRDNSQYAKFIYKHDGPTAEYFLDGAYYYMGGGAEEYNAWLAGIEPAAEGTKKKNDETFALVIKTLDKLISLFPKIKKDMVVFRGISRRREDDPLINLISNLKPGDEFTNVAYSSTSIIEGIAKGFSGKDEYVLEIVVPKGSNGLFVDPANGNKFEEPDTYSDPELFSEMEAELILPRDTTFKVISRDGNRIKVVALPKVAESSKPEKTSKPKEDATKVISELNPVKDAKKYQEDLGKLYDTILGDNVNEANATAMRVYQEDQNIWIATNYRLRSDKTTSQLEEEYGVEVSDLVAVTNAFDEEIEKVQGLPVDTLLYRGTRSRSAERFFSFGVGEEFTDLGFISTSLEYDTAEMFATVSDGNNGVILEIEAPSGTKAISLAAYFGDEVDSESEIVLSRGTTFRVLSKTEATDGKLRTMRVTVVDQTENVAQKPATVDEEDVSYNDIENWTKVGPKKGSNEGGTFRDQNGNDYYVKEPRSTLHAQNEALAAALYKELQVPAVVVLLGEKNSELRTVSPIVKSIGVLGYSPDRNVVEKLQEGFAVDAWLANWDVAGLAFDNVIIDTNGNPVRVDPGGALMWRAQGEPKGKIFGDVVGEIDTLRDKGMAPEASVIFGDMTDDQVKESAKVLLNISPERIDEIVDSIVTDFAVAADLKLKLRNRRQGILDRFGLTDTDKVAQPIELVPSEQENEPDNSVKTVTTLGADISTPNVLIEGRDAAPDHTPRDKELIEKLVAEGPQAMGSQFVENWAKAYEEYDGNDQEAADAALFLYEMKIESIEKRAETDEFIQNAVVGILATTMSYVKYAVEKERPRLSGEVRAWRPQFPTDLIQKGRLNENAFWTDLARYFDNPKLIDVEMTPASAFLRVMRAWNGDGWGPKEYDRFLSFHTHRITDDDHPLKYMLTVGQEVLLRPSSWTNAGELTNFAGFTGSRNDGTPEDYEDWDGDQISPLEVGHVVLRVAVDNAYPIDSLSSFSEEKESIIPNGRYRVKSVERVNQSLGDLKTTESFVPYTLVTLEVVPSKRTEKTTAIEPIEENPVISVKSKYTNWINGAALYVDDNGVTIGEDVDYNDVYALKNGRIAPPALPFFVPVYDLNNPESGEGYYFAQSGNRYWGRYGAAGALLRRLNASGEYEYLLAKRSESISAGGGKWAWPGGAHKNKANAASPYLTAYEELDEELGYYPTNLKPVASHTNFVEPDWKYETVIVDVTDDKAIKDNLKINDSENTELDWFLEEDIYRLKEDNMLHPAVASSIEDVLAVSTSNPSNALEQTDVEDEEESNKKDLIDMGEVEITPTGRPKVVLDQPLPLSASAIDGTYSLMGAIDHVKNTDAVAVSALVDGGDIEDLEVRASVVVDQSTGEKKISLKFKLTHWAATRFLSPIRAARDTNVEWVSDPYRRQMLGLSDDLSEAVIIEKQVIPEEFYADPTDGTIVRTFKPAEIVSLTSSHNRAVLYDGSIVVIDDTQGKTGAEYQIVDPRGKEFEYPDLGIDITDRPYALDSPARSYNNTVQIYLPLSATEEQITKALKAAGVENVRAASIEDLNIIAENRLLSLFEKYTDPNINLQDQNLRDSFLERIALNEGISIENIEYRVSDTGRLEMLMPQAKATEIAQRLSIDVFEHKMTNIKGAMKYYDENPDIGRGYIKDIPREYIQKYAAELIMEVISSQRLTSTMTRLFEGIKKTGMSSETDIEKGSADYVFTTPRENKTSPSPFASEGHEHNLSATVFVFSAEKLLRRLDIYGNRDDSFGERAESHDIYGEIDLRVGMSYEAMFKNDIDFSEYLMHISTAEEIRYEILSMLNESGITEMFGIPVEELFVTHGDVPNRKEKAARIAKMAEKIEDLEQAQQNIGAEGIDYYEYTQVIARLGDVYGYGEDTWFLPAPHGSRILGIISPHTTYSAPAAYVLEPSGLMYQYTGMEGATLTQYDLDTKYNKTLIRQDTVMRTLAILNVKAPEIKKITEYMYGTEKNNVFTYFKSGISKFDVPTYIPAGMVNHYLSEDTWRQSLDNLIEWINEDTLNDKLHPKTVLLFWAASKMPIEAREALEKLIDSFALLGDPIVSSAQQIETPSYVSPLRYIVETGNIIAGIAGLATKYLDGTETIRPIYALQRHAIEKDSGNMAIVLSVDTDTGEKSFELKQGTDFVFDKKTGIGTFSTASAQYRIQPLESLYAERDDKAKKNRQAK